MNRLAPLAVLVFLFCPAVASATQPNEGCLQGCTAPSEVSATLIGAPERGSVYRAPVVHPEFTIRVTATPGATIGQCTLRVANLVIKDDKLVVDNATERVEAHDCASGFTVRSDPDRYYFLSGEVYGSGGSVAGYSTSWSVLGAADDTRTTPDFVVTGIPATGTLAPAGRNVHVAATLTTGTEIECYGRSSSSIDASGERVYNPWFIFDCAGRDIFGSGGEHIELLIRAYGTTTVTRRYSWDVAQTYTRESSYSGTVDRAGMVTLKYRCVRSAGCGGGAWSATTKNGRRIVTIVGSKPLKRLKQGESATLRQRFPALKGSNSLRLTMHRVHRPGSHVSSSFDLSRTKKGGTR